MKDYTFKIPQEIIFGPGVLNRLPELLKKVGQKTMIVSDHGLEKGWCCETGYGFGRGKWDQGICIS